MATNPFIRSNDARLPGPADRTGIVVDAHAKAAARAVGPPVSDERDYLPGRALYGPTR